jgi:competence protein ComEC
MQKLAANILVIISAIWILFALFYFSLPEPIGIEKQQIEFEAKIVEIPEFRQNKVVLIVENEVINSRVRITTKNFAQYNYGDFIRTEGVIEEPENFADFNWRGFLAKEGIYYVMHNAQVEKIKDADFNIQKYLAGVKAKLSSGIDASLLPPNSSFYKAMLFHERSEITESQNLKFQQTGLSHILAISGMHITIITVILFYVLTWLGMWRRHASYFALTLSTLYILMVGAPASAVRAGIMAAAIVLAETFGRPKASWRALLYAAAIMLAFNPLLARYDLGFQLSFLAVLGIILFYERLEKFFAKAQKFVVRLVLREKITKDMPVADYLSETKFTFNSILSVTLSAQVLTTPLIIYNFGIFSAWSPLTNLLVVPVLPLTLPAGILVAAAGAVGFFPEIFAAPAWLFANYIWWIVNIFG